jgi:hypothetical protein
MVHFEAPFASSFYGPINFVVLKYEHCLLWFLYGNYFKNYRSKYYSEQVYSSQFCYMYNMSTPTEFIMWLMHVCKAKSMQCIARKLRSDYIFGKYGD